MDKPDFSYCEQLTSADPIYHHFPDRATARMIPYRGRRQGSAFVGDSQTLLSVLSEVGALFVQQVSLVEAQAAHLLGRWPKGNTEFGTLAPYIKEVIGITQGMFPGDPVIRVVTDPDCPEEQHVVVEMPYPDGHPNLLESRLEWHRRISALGVPAGDLKLSFASDQ